MKTPGTSGFGAAQKKKLAELLVEIEKFRTRVLVDDVGGPDAFALRVRALVVQLQALAAPILSVETEVRLNLIDEDSLDYISASKAWAELDAIVPAVEDAIDAINSRPGALLPGSLEQLLRGRGLDTASEDVERALHAADSDPPVAITAARAGLESLLKGYIEDRGLARPSHPKTGNLLKTAMGDLGLDPADKADKDVQNVLQSLWSVMHGISDLHTHAGSAHGRGKRPYRLHARHARLAVQASQTVIEFFVETWNYREGRSSSD